MSLRNIDLPVMNSITLIPYLKCYSDSGYNPSTLLKKFNIKPEHINENVFIPSFLSGHIISTIELSTGINNIGVAAFISGDFKQVHPKIADELKKTQNLLDLVLILKSYKKLQGSHFDLRIKYEQGTLFIYHLSSIPKASTQYQQNEHLRTLSIIKLIKQRLGDYWKPEFLYMSATTSPPIEIISSTTSGKVYINQEYACIPIRIDLEHLSDNQKTNGFDINPESALERLKLISKIFIEHEDLSLPFISDLFGCSVRTLQRVLKQNGMNFRDYIKDEKLKHATLLLNQNNPVNLVASKIGYNEPANFTRAFKAHFGVAPSMYNNIHKKI